MFILIRYTKGFCISTAHRPAMRINITYILIASMCDGPLPPLFVKTTQRCWAAALCATQPGGQLVPVLNDSDFQMTVQDGARSVIYQHSHSFLSCVSPFQFVISYNSHGSREIELSFPLYYYYRSHILLIYMLLTVFWITTRLVWHVLMLKKHIRHCDVKKSQS